MKIKPIVPVKVSQQEQDEIAKLLLSENLPSLTEPDLEGRIIDLNPADKGSNKTQDQWIKYFNERNEIMVSMPDLYQAGKSSNQTLLNSLRKDFKKSWFVSSTRIRYEKNQDARIIHNYGNKLVQQLEHPILIPEYRSKSLADVLNTNEGLAYLQILFGTEDNSEQIKDTLQKLSNYTTDKTKVWSAALSNRPVERAADLSCDSGGFHVYGNGILNCGGCSRGVRR